MPINLDKPHLWNSDTNASVDQFNEWFLESAPKAYRETRVRTTEKVQDALRKTDDLRNITVSVLRDHPGILSTLRMACCPPLAVDRLIGLAGASSTLVKKMESGELPKRLEFDFLQTHLAQIVRIIDKLLDRELFPWLASESKPTSQQRYRASTIVADRLCGSVANPLIKNAQEKRQLALMEAYLKRKGYRKVSHPNNSPIREMSAGTYGVHVSVSTGSEGSKINVSVDVAIQPMKARRNSVPILIEAKSAGDYTNTNKRRKEEAKKMSQLKETLGDKVCYILFLCGYFDSGYLGYEAASGIDWVWEHRISDFEQLGI